MKSFLYLLFLESIIVSGLCGCGTGTEDHKEFIPEDSISSNFHYDDIGRLIIKVVIDGNEYDAIFDTGGGSKIILDRNIFGYLASDSLSRKSISFPYSGSSMDILYCGNDITVLFNDDTLHYSGYGIGDIAKRFNVDVLLPLPFESDKVWNINYETSNVDVSDDTPVDVRNNYDISSPITEHDNHYFISIPFSCLENDSTEIDCLLSGCFDTGSNRGITLFGGLCCLQNARLESVVSTKKMRILHSRSEICFLKAEGELDDLIEFDIRPASSGYVALNFGNAFLSHYNFWLDLKNKMMYGKLNDNYRYSQKYRYANVSAKSSIKGSFTDKGFLVRDVIPDSNMEKSGIQKGDLFLSVDGKDIHSLSLNDFKQYKSDSLVHFIDLSRSGNRIRIQSYFYK